MTDGNIYKQLCFDIFKKKSRVIKRLLSLKHSNLSSYLLTMKTRTKLDLLLGHPVKSNFFSFFCENMFFTEFFFKQKKLDPNSQNKRVYPFQKKLLQKKKIIIGDTPTKKISGPLQKKKFGIPNPLPPPKKKRENYPYRSRESVSPVCRIFFG